MIHFCYQGGLSSGYKNCIADKGLNDETYSSDGVALIQISGTSVHNNKAVQVDAVCTLLEFLLLSYLLKSCNVGLYFLILTLPVLSFVLSSCKFIHV